MLHSVVSSASPSGADVSSFHEKVQQGVMIICVCTSCQAKKWVTDFLALGKHVTVTGIKCTLFLSLSDHFFQLALSIIDLKNSNLNFSNYYLLAKSI